MDTATLLDIARILGLLGVGGIVTTIVTHWFRRNKEAAETEEIVSRTNRSISEIVEAKTQKLVEDYEQAITRINDLERQVRDMKLELDTNRQIMRIRSLEADVRFYKSRVEVLEAQNLSLIEAMENGR